MKNKLICQLAGGLGNQLFTYAAAVRLAQHNDMELVVDNVSGFSRDFSYRRSYELHHFNIKARIASRSERLEPFGRVRRFVAKSINKRRGFHQRNYVFQDFIAYDERLLELTLSQSTYFTGYWQSYKYFQSIRSQLLEEFQLCDATAESIGVSEEIGLSNSVGVHIRFFDEDLTKDTARMKSMRDYYTAAIAYMKEQIVEPHFFIFTDVPERANGLNLFKNTQHTILSDDQCSNSAIQDFHNLRLCDHFIIGSSTFSWWAAWLGLNSNKIVVCPAQIKTNESSSWGFDGLLPSNWIKL